MATDINVDTYAAGNGTTDDTQALRQAIGTGRHLRFTRGKTYLYSGMLVLQAGQIAYGNGATLKRRAQAGTTTSTPIVAGQTTTIEVADASGLAVGMDLVLRSGDKYDPNNRTIRSISGNTVTVSSAFGISSSGSSDVFSSAYGLWLRDNGRVYDLIMDGNRASTSYSTWENTREIHVQGVRAIVSGCYLRDAPGIGIYLERDSITIRDCTIVDVGGSGIQLGYANRAIIDRVRIENANLDDTLRHSDGCITVTNSVDHLTVSGCYLANGLSGVGGLDQTDNSNVTIAGNTIVGCRATALEGLSPGQSAPANMLIANNRVYDSGALQLKGVGGSRTTVFTSRVAVQGNYLRNTRIEVGRARHVDIADNVIEDSGTSANQIEIADSRHVSVRGNVLDGGNNGVSVATSESVLVEGNSFLGQSQGAVVMGGAGTNCQATGNSVTADERASSTYRGITVSARCVARGNMLSLAGGEAAIHANSQSTVKDNVVRSGGATYGIRVAGGATGVLVKDNEVTAPVSNGGGAGNVETGTVAIPA